MDIQRLCSEKTHNAIIKLLELLQLEIRKDKIINCFCVVTYIANSFTLLQHPEVKIVLRKSAKCDAIYGRYVFFPHLPKYHPNVWEIMLVYENVNYKTYILRF